MAGYSRDLTEGPLARQILTFSVPLMFSTILQVLFNMADVAVIGRFAGAMQLGSVGSTTILVTLFTGFLVGLGNGVNVLAMGAFYVAPQMACDIADAYLNAELGSGYEWWKNFYEFHKLAIDELEAFDYETYKANGFKVEHLGDYPLKLEVKPED